jgi:siroheme synthase-like protein
MAESQLPIILQSDNDLGLLVGGNPLALQRAHWLREHGWRIRLVVPVQAPVFGDFLKQRGPEVEVLERTYRSEDVEGVALAIAATESPAVNAAVSADARRRRIPVHVIDNPALSTFQVPATLQRGPLEIAVAAGNGSSALAARVRTELEVAYPAWYADYAAALSWAQERLIERCPDPGVRRRVLTRLAERKTADELTSLRGDMLRREIVQRGDGWLRRETDTDAHRRDSDG